jgi:hypothetical protein
MNLIAVIGDVHAEIDKAAQYLFDLEAQLGEPISQVFSVGDLGLFLAESDWQFLTGPTKHRHPEKSQQIRAVWQAWKWPIAAIGGNHEPWHRLRVFDQEYFGPKLSYTNAGELQHCIGGLGVYGLSGIHHPEHLEYDAKKLDRRPAPANWAELVVCVREGKAAARRLTYFKSDELALLSSLPPGPHLLLMHDWPASPTRHH